MGDVLLMYSNILAPLFASFMCGAILQQWIHRREFNEWVRMFDRLFAIVEKAQKTLDDQTKSEDA